MAQVTVGQIENLVEAVTALHNSYASLEDACQAKQNQAAIKLAECEAEKVVSATLLTKVVAHEALKGLEMAETATRHVQADAELATAMASGNPVAIAAAAAHVAETLAQLQQALEAYEAAKNQRMQMECRAELAEQALARAQLLVETVQGKCSFRLNNSSHLLDNGTARLRQAQQILEQYHADNPVAAAFQDWLNWSPTAYQPVTPAEFNRRLNLSAQQQRLFFNYLAERDAAFRDRLAAYRKELASSRGPVERQAVQQKMRRHLSGYAGEKLVEFALKPLGAEVNTQHRTTLDGGRYTKTDLIISGLKVPVILGRGEGRYAPVGGSIAIEVKCGRAAYLRQQRDHMVFQSGGHRQATAAVTICSRDIKDLQSEQEEELREALRQAGSPLIGMLPPKNDMDQILWALVTGKEGDH